MALIDPNCRNCGKNFSCGQHESWPATASPIPPPTIDGVGEAMKALSEEDRLQVMSRFCRSCGIVQPETRRCQCNNDE